jgi:ABC-type proline/glycine betaine transport system ATPase subunit
MAVEPTHRAAVVEFEHVTKRYDAPVKRKDGTTAPSPGALNDLSLTVPAGKICVFVGPSGCGKTTSLKMVNRLIEPTDGRILIDGVDAATRDVTELRRSIGYVIQQVGLFPHQTIAENVATVLGWSAPRRRERAEELLAVVGLDPATYGSRYPVQLSGGERQRVGVARALAADPPIMLMDEPFGAVDPIVRERLQDEFLRLQESLAKTILARTHRRAIKMGDVAVLARASWLSSARRPDPGQPGIAVRRPIRRQRPRPQAPEPEPGRRPPAPAPGHRAGGRGRNGGAVPGHSRLVPVAAPRRRARPAGRLDRPRGGSSG